MVNLDFTGVRSHLLSITNNFSTGDYRGRSCVVWIDFTGVDPKMNELFVTKWSIDNVRLWGGRWCPPPDYYFFLIKTNL